MIIGLRLSEDYVTFAEMLANTHPAGKFYPCKSSKELALIFEELRGILNPNSYSWDELD
jgi:hypothetical protein